jgi:hypothetical protein
LLDRYLLTASSTLDGLLGDYFRLDFVPVVASALTQTQQLIALTTEYRTLVAQAQALRFDRMANRYAIQDQFQRVRINHGVSFT